MFTGGYDYPIPEGGGLPRGEAEIQLFTAIAEDLFSERIGGEKAIPTSVPVGGITRVMTIVADGNAEGVVALFAVEHTPSPAGAPGAVARFTFAGEVVAVDIRCVAGGHFCDISFVIDEFAGGIRRYLQFFCNAETEHAVLRVGKRHAGINQCGEGGRTVDDPFVCVGCKVEGRPFEQQWLFLLVDPVGGIV